MGLSLPLLAAAIAVPTLLNLIGVERMGVLMLIWGLTAVSGLFDLGIGRAATHAIAEGTACSDSKRRDIIAFVATRLTLLVGSVGGIFVWCLGLLDIISLLNLKVVNQYEVSLVVFMLGLIVPTQAQIATYRGVCEGLQRFRGVSLVRMTMGCANYFAPLAAAAFTTSLPVLAGSLLIVRVAALFALRQIANSGVILSVELARKEQLEISQELVSKGGWLSVSAIISPVLVQSDRFILGAMLSAAIVTVYAIPFDVITQLLVLVSAVSSVAFPSIAASRIQDSTRTRAAFRRWLYVLAAVMAIVCSGVAFFWDLVLYSWLGDSFPAEAVAVGRWLCFGVWLNSIGGMYYAWLHAHGHFRETALLHMLELIPHLCLLYFFVSKFGVVGAAMAWTVRVGFDVFGLLVLTWRLDRSEEVQAKQMLTTGTQESK